MDYTKARELAEATNARLCLPSRHLCDESHDARTYTERVNLGLRRRFQQIEQERQRRTFEVMSEDIAALPVKLVGSGDAWTQLRSGGK